MILAKEGASMGGPGSGTWWRWQGRKTTVEQCHVLSISNLPKPLIVGASGRLPNGIDFSIAGTLERRYLRLDWTWKKRKRVELAIPLTTTPTTFGGVRDWFLCPLHKVGTPCDKRVMKLYSPAGDSLFACRKCHDLTYMSSQEAHRNDRMGTRFGVHEIGVPEWDDFEQLLRDD
jgi:hypothetical protein